MKRLHRGRRLRAKTRQPEPGPLPHEVEPRARAEAAQRQAENDHAATEAKYLSLIESLPAIVYVAHPRPPYSPVYVSPYVESLGYRLEEWYRRPDLWVSLIHPDDRERVLDTTRTFAETRRDNDYEYRMLLPDGSVRWFHDRGRFVLNAAGDLLCWQGVIVDITERRKAEAALRQSNTLKTALLDAMSHDLRTPLTSIKGAVTILLGRMPARSVQHPAVDGDDRRALLRMIDEEVDRLDNFIESHVQLARLDDGDGGPPAASAAVEDIVGIAVGRAKSLLTRHPLALSLEPHLPAVRIAVGAAAEVLYLLIDNAAKHTAPDTPIRISAERHAEGFVRVTVDDDGTGIPVALRSRVFDQFFRVPSPGGDNRRPSGTGSGLYIARQIVAAYNGRIWVEATPAAAGTRVVFVLPDGGGEAPLETRASNQARRRRRRARRSGDSAT